MNSTIITTLNHPRFQIARLEKVAVPRQVADNTQEQAKEGHIPTGPPSAELDKPLIPRPPHPPYKSADPETVALIEWFNGANEQLPKEPFQLAPEKKIIHPDRFYQSLRAQIALYPNGVRAHVIGDDLRNLRFVMQKTRT